MAQLRQNSHARRGPQGNRLRRLRIERLEPRIVLDAQPLITEFMASNDSVLQDSFGGFSDWIEVTNNGDMSVNLAGWHLTDNAADLTKWTFPDTNLAARESVIVFATGKPERPLNTNFGLASDGEYLALVRPDGTVANEFAPEFPAQFSDVSYGLVFDPSTQQVAQPLEEAYFNVVTPGAVNAAPLAGVVADTVFSVERGFYESPFELALSNTTAGATIRYTRDGTDPSLHNGTVYTSPIIITETSIVRAAAFKTGYLTPSIETHTYLFLDDVLTQSADGQPPAGWPASWGANRVDYGMDPEIVNSPVWGPQLQDALRALSTISIVTDLDNLFSPSTGIYANPGNRGEDWERPTSMEMIHPNGDEGFQVDAGIRIRGGSSRRTSNAKHSLRFFFRSEYGDTKLRYPLFGDEGVAEFDHIDLRTSSDFSWENGSSRFVFLRDVFSRDSQRDVGQPYTRTRYHHVYINGEYWGIYQTQEKPKAPFGESYFGGDKEDYDAIKIHRGSDQETFTLQVSDGNLRAYRRLWALTVAGFETPEAYWRAQGRNPDGALNPEFQQLLDLDNLIDLMLVIFYTGNRDEPLSGFLGNERPNNIWALYNRNGGDGFKFFTHDNENTLDDGEIDRTGPFLQASLEFKHFNPQVIHQAMLANPEYRQRFADRVQQHLFLAGPLTDGVSNRRLNARRRELGPAIVAESARWGDSSRSSPYTRDDWISAVNVVRGFFTGRNNIVLNQLIADGLYPNVDAPVFGQHGGEVPAGFQLTMSASAPTIYYTTDGSDPRTIGGGINPSAIGLQSSGPSSITIDSTTTVKARALDVTQWSALSEADFAVESTTAGLVVSEVMYHPDDPSPAEMAAGFSSDGEFEFLEFFNSNTDRTISLSGVEVVEGPSAPFSFSGSNVTSLEPGEFALVVSNQAAFEFRYGAALSDQIAGEFAGQLSNGGEQIQVVDSLGADVLRFTYSDDPPWPTAADGSGFSLVLVDPTSNPDYSDASHWQASTRIGGSPGVLENLAGDFDGDGDVDGRDLLAMFRDGRETPSHVEHAQWQQNYGSGVEQPANEIQSDRPGDVDLDGDVDGDDFLRWQRDATAGNAIDASAGRVAWEDNFGLVADASLTVNDLPPTGDYDEDGFVGGRDLLWWQRDHHVVIDANTSASDSQLNAWQNGFGASPVDVAASTSQLFSFDHDSDRDIDGRDLLVWQRQIASPSSAEAFAQLDESIAAQVLTANDAAALAASAHAFGDTIFSLFGHDAGVSEEAGIMIDAFDSALREFQSRPLPRRHFDVPAELSRPFTPLPSQWLDRTNRHDLQQLWDALSQEVMQKQMEDATLAFLLQSDY